MCDRHFGIGADGLILIEEDQEADFNMVYYNADGGEGSLCGNGARCAVAFAQFLGLIENIAEFRASDGLHSATITDNTIRLAMHNVDEIREKPDYYYLDTGSPHHVQLVDDLAALDVKKEGARLRYGLYGVKGSNINFVQHKGKDKFVVRTYERGVEDETYSCGTGVTAVALAMHKSGKTSGDKVAISTRGGELTVGYVPMASGYRDIFLEGPATFVFKGIFEW